MIHNGKPMKGYVFVSGERYKKKDELKHLVGLCVSYNKTAKNTNKKQKSS